MKFKDAVLKNRSYRRFDSKLKISEKQLIHYVDLARQTASAANKQPLKYLVSCDSEKNEMIFQNLLWAGYLKEWDGPQEGEKPTGYIVILGDDKISKSCDFDFGIAAQTILLAATFENLGGCMFTNVNRVQLSKQLQLADHLTIVGVIALGKPIENVIIEPLVEKGEIQYWRDEQQVHHVPKRSLESIVIPASH